MLESLFNKVVDLRLATLLKTGSNTAVFPLRHFKTLCYVDFQKAGEALGTRKYESS